MLCVLCCMFKFNTFTLDEDYIRKKFRDVESVNDQTLRGLRWDSAMVRQVNLIRRFLALDN